MLDLDAATFTRASLKQLETHVTDLEFYKGTLDHFFTMFFDSMSYADMGEDTTTPEWLLYRKMKDEYDRIDQLIRSANYYLGQA